jgi:hypothetical protein
VRIDFCEADVLDVFDEWRRAIGVSHAAISDQPSAISHQPSASKGSLPAHLERVVTRLTAARANGSLGAAFDEVIDRAAHELDAARAAARGLRGDARVALLARLTALDRELLQEARGTLDDDALANVAREAETELAPFRGGMTAEAFAEAREAAIDRLVRDRFGLPTISFT